MPRKTLDEFFNEEHPAVTAAAVTAAIEAAFAADPVGWGNPGRTLPKVETHWNSCQQGDPTLGGDPYENRALSCYNDVVQFWHDYQVTGVAADYAAALALFDYGVNTFGNVNGRDYWADVVALMQGAFGG